MSTIIDLAKVIAEQEQSISVLNDRISDQAQTIEGLREDLQYAEQGRDRYYDEALNLRDERDRLRERVHRLEMDLGDANLKSIKPEDIVEIIAAHTDRIPAIKAVREKYHIGLKEAHDLVIQNWDTVKK